MNKLIITPKTKVYDLLEEYPELEDTMIEMIPQFRKLKNPLLRKTIAKVTTLQQAASIGAVKVDQLVNGLRQAAGQEQLEELKDVPSAYKLEKPGWFDEDRISATLDIRDMLERGEQPVHEVLATLKKLEGETILKIIAPFLPAPLIDKSTGLNVDHWVNQQKEGLYFVYFFRE